MPASHEELLETGNLTAVELGATETLDPPDWEEFRTLAHDMLDKMIGLQRNIRNQPVWRPYR